MLQIFATIFFAGAALGALAVLAASLIDNRDMIRRALGRDEPYLQPQPLPPRIRLVPAPRRARMMTQAAIARPAELRAAA
ncbi:hypothetical protein CLG96_09290 [Sphingomonas oleivorans]|uniref:Uncharacterized protein n=1 Tax=Sphingomonas oleivorans TaxID=1735121 RepID=A0A2T5FYJ0_9SPHN|nr:hypothetical protein [Sphingomonas oleivorans]PTQ11608.1 hypothetical protein CLG96_09290 [Sphingomonas oleivorans]